MVNTPTTSSTTAAITAADNKQTPSGSVAMATTADTTPTAAPIAVQDHGLNPGPPVKSGRWSWANLMEALAGRQRLRDAIPRPGTVQACTASRTAVNS
jgi:hypothetical protein